MLVGAMNFPGRSVLKELHRIAEDKFDFCDLTLEPPAAWLPDGKEVGRLAGDLGLGLVGHTAWHLPLASPFESIRDQARDEFRRGLDCFADAGVELVNVHPDQRVPIHNRDQIIRLNIEALELLSRDASQRGITLMVENLDRRFGDVADLAPLLEAVPELSFHLDVAHANLNTGYRGGNRTEALLEAFGDRLAHVHLSDNRGGDQDLHLPLGAGAIDWPKMLSILKATGYDGTITLEVFSRERDYLRASRRLLLAWWTEA